MLNPSILFSLCSQLVRPEGFWAHAGHPAFCKRYDGAYADCGPSDETGIVPAVTAPAVPSPGGPIRPLIFVSFKCPEFGTNSAGVRLSDWPRYQRALGKRRILSAHVVGSLV